MITANPHHNSGVAKRSPTPPLPPSSPNRYEPYTTTTHSTLLIRVPVSFVRYRTSTVLSNLFLFNLCPYDVFGNLFYTFFVPLPVVPPSRRDLRRAERHRGVPARCVALRRSRRSVARISRYVRSPVALVGILTGTRHAPACCLRRHRPRQLCEEARPRR